MLKGDFHMHTCYSKDCATPPERLVARAIQVGLTCIAVTDHNNVEGALAAERVVRNQSALLVIVAEEVKTSQGEIIGLFLKETIQGGLSPEETCRRIKAQGGLISIPHPFDRFRRSPLKFEALQSILSEIDAFEVFNSRTTLLRDSRKALDFAKEHNLPTLAGSDAHHPWELGHVFVELPEFKDAEGFKKALNHIQVHGRRSTPLVHLITRYVKWRKKLFKAPVPAPSRSHN